MEVTKLDGSGVTMSEARAVASGEQAHGETSCVCRVAGSTRIELTVSGCEITKKTGQVETNETETGRMGRVRLEHANTVTKQRTKEVSMIGKIRGKH